MKKDFMISLAGITIPFSYLSDNGVGAYCRLCLGLNPLFADDGRGSHGISINPKTGLPNMAEVLLTPEGIEWAKNYKKSKK